LIPGFKTYSATTDPRAALMWKDVGPLPCFRKKECPGNAVYLVPSNGVPYSLGAVFEISSRTEPHLIVFKLGPNRGLNLVPKDGLEPSTPRL
jgi:hypothetical protein